MSDKQLINGLTTTQAQKLQERYGKNELSPREKQGFVRKLVGIVKEPMFLLLIAVSVIYFILGEGRDGAVMLVFVAGIIGIDVIQEWKTDKTLQALKSLSAPRITVIRDGGEMKIDSADLVPGDIMLLHEGVKIPADGLVLSCQDLSVDESSLTGESENVWKQPYNGSASSDEHWRKDFCYAGTLVAQGSAVVRVEHIGAATQFGTIGAAVAVASDEKTPLQKQTGAIVKVSALVAAGLFILVGVVTYFNNSDMTFNERVVDSILAGITLSMAMIPEEFPVILTVFLSMGAWRLAKKNSLVRRLPSVETLGAVSVLCVDKTGTITMNQMMVQETWATDNDEERLCEVMGLACETEPYDPMEKAMLAYCQKSGITTEHLFSEPLISEYAFTNETKMMGHVWHHENEIILAAKGSPEKLLRLCALSEVEMKVAEDKINNLSEMGLRVIAVGMMKPGSSENIPEKLSEATLKFCGLVALSDPPRAGVAEEIARCNRAGIRVVMITGDNGVTAAAIARKVGISISGGVITGDALSAMSDDELRQKVRTVSIYSRVLPEHKMRIVKAFQSSGDIVAMTGDGVNDAPALKSADIGIAMGMRGSEVSREAADLILLDDNFTTIVDTVRDGRRIFDNIRKAVGYVFTIHIPIAFSSLLAPMLGISPASLFLLPLHVVLLELVIDPTCSVVLERQPPETDIMDRPPRNPREKLLTKSMLLKSVLQGTVILAASFGAYYVTLAQQPGNAPTARSMGLVVIMAANLLLVLVNSSDFDSIFVSAKRLIREKIVWMVNIMIGVMIFVSLYTPLNAFLKLAQLTLLQILLAGALAAVSVLWYELVKANARAKRRKALAH